MNINLEMFIKEIENSKKSPFEKWEAMYHAIERLKKEKDKYFDEIHGK